MGSSSQLLKVCFWNSWSVIRSTFSPRIGAPKILLVS
jgi:hypothetical protein